MQCTRKSLVLLLLLVSACVSGSPARQAKLDPFLDLAAAYAKRDARAASANYSEDAEQVDAYDGLPERHVKGRANIERSFAEFFGSLDKGQNLDLNYRVTAKKDNRTTGVFRVRLGRSKTSYGWFQVDRDGTGLFRRDESRTSTRTQFEEAAGPLLVSPDDNDLDRAYYSLLTGRYRLPDGCDLIVTLSLVRPFVRNSCTQRWQGLQRRSGLEWTAGGTVLSDKSQMIYRFAPVSDAPSASLTLTDDKATRVAVRQTPYTTETVHFQSADGTALSGVLYAPTAMTGMGPSVVMVHGSGPQDRNGYASIIAVMADELAASGRVVLAFDKRGSGESSGNGDGAGFDVLANDVRAAMAYLSTRPHVDPARIGLAGSSQAGWVIAKAIAHGAKPADVFLLGAAGSAFSVREQNLYNTEVRMACAGIAEPDRALALSQQAAFFDALADRTRAPILDELTRKATTNPALRDWIFPDSSGLDAPDSWFTVLDPTFDPRPVWDAYSGQATFVFSQFDDATDTTKAIERMKASKHRPIKLAGSQHLGLVTGSVCDGELGGREQFNPQLFLALDEYARGVGSAKGGR